MELEIIDGKKNQSNLKSDGGDLKKSSEKIFSKLKNEGQKGG